MHKGAIPLVFNSQYLEVLRTVDDAFQAQARATPDHPCRRGCAHCCHGPFDVGRGDLWLLAEGLARADESTRAGVLQRVAATAQTQRVALELRPSDEIGLDAIGEERFDDFCDEHISQPCPILAEDGSCALYAYRPEPCRLRGATVLDAGELVDMSCPMGWTDGLSPLELDFVDLQARISRLEANVDMPGWDGERTTIALGMSALLGGR